jgi:ATP-binding cassette subfamily B multidrug efflux pump
LEQEQVSGKIVDISVLKRLFKFVHPYITRFYFLVFLTVTLAVLMAVRPKLIQVAIDRDIALMDYSGLVVMIAILVALLMMQAFVQYLHTYLSGWLGQNIIRDIRIKLFKHIQNLNLRFFDKTPIGRLVTRNISDIETLSEVFSQGIAAMVGDLLLILVILGVMIYTDWKLTLVSLSTLPILLFSTYIFKEKIKTSFNQVRTAVSNLNSFVQEHITGMNIVQIFNSEQREYEKFKEINREHRKAHVKSVMYYSVYFPIAEVIQASGFALVVWYGAGEVISSNLSFGVLIEFIMYIMMFFRPIRQ